MIIEQTPLPEVYLIKPKVFGDSRGFFLETFNKDRYAEHGLSVQFVQDNHSRSARNVLRGLHYQLRHPQGKLVYVVRGAAFDVAVDIRRGSPNFGKWYGVELSDQNNYQLYIPPGFAHGFCALSEMVDFTYKCTDVYHPEDERGVIWNDPEIGVSWPVSQPMLSKKDMQYSMLSMTSQDDLPVYLK